ncbi:hypothetical protein [Microbispora sp. NPDC049125]|uniref:hypothetical protein n=1 Tax=Microbispora sp. NPDC049125 TaxID=3154929 RepID=UPI003465E084
MAGMWATGYSLHEAGENPGKGVVLVGVAAGAGAIASSVKSDALRKFLKKSTWRRAWSGGCLAAAAAWTAGAVKYGASLDNSAMTALLVTVGPALSAPWWFRYRGAGGKPVAAPAPQAAPVAPVQVERAPESPELETAEARRAAVRLEAQGIVERWREAWKPYTVTSDQESVRLYELVHDALTAEPVGEGNPVTAERIWETLMTCGTWLPTALEFERALNEGHPHHQAWKPLSDTMGSVLPHSFLSNPEPLFDYEGNWNGTAWEVNLRPGKEDTSRLLNAIQTVRSAFDRDNAASLIFGESHPGGNLSKGRVVVLDRNPLDGNIEWMEPGLDWETGAAPISVYPDGSGWALFKFFNPGSGPVHTQIAGTTNAGKSGVLRWINIEALRAQMVVWLFDPQRGASFPGLRKYVSRTWYGMDQIKVGMRAADAVMGVREDWLVDNDLGQFDAVSALKDHGRRILVLVFDEVPDLLADPDNNALMASLVRKARKTGIKLVLASQVTSIEQYGNAGNVIRENVASGNGIILRVAQAMTGRMAYQGASDISPHLLPEYFDPRTKTRSTGGLGYVMPGREMPSRVANVPISKFAEAVELGYKPARLEDEAEELVDRIVQEALNAGEMEDRRRNRGTAAPAAPAAAAPEPSLASVTPLRSATGSLLTGSGDPAADRRAVVTYLRQRGGEGSLADMLDTRQWGSPTSLLVALEGLAADGKVESVGPSGSGQYVLKGELVGA